MGSRNWCFTLNNYTNEQVSFLETRALGGGFTYLVFGYETAASGTPHLQGYFSLNRSKKLVDLKRWLTPLLREAHLEISRGTPVEASTYCKKDDNVYYEHGELPAQQGQRTDLSLFREWCMGLDAPPTDRQICAEERFFGLFVKYNRLAQAGRLIGRHRFPITEGFTCGGPGGLSIMYGWQLRARALLDGLPSRRVINFVVGMVGGEGKTAFAQWYSNENDNVQLLNVSGKKSDMTYILDETKTCFLINVPRGSMEFLSYSFLEEIKDCYVTSPKYESRNKYLELNHVMVFSNEEPNMNMLSIDRFNVIHC